MMVPQQQRRRRRRAAMVRTSERRVVVVRGPGGFGFTIAGQRPCVVSAVAEDGPAERAGLRAGDALLAVDGASVARAPHTSVARLIAAAPSAISLSVAPRESPPTDTEDTEPDERARTRRRHPPPRRRPQPAMLHHPACHSAGGSAVNEILQNLSRAQLSPNQVARLECRAVVAYLGTIETPQAAANAAPDNVRTAVRKLRQERRPAAPILLCVLPNCLILRRPSAQPLAQYPRERIIYVGSGSEADRRYFGLVTSAELSDLECSASHSCHVFAVDSRMAEHEAHVNRAREFQIACTRDPVAERCLEFPPSAEYVVGVIRGMYSLPADDCSSPILQQISKLAVKGDSPAMGNFTRGNRAVLRPRDRRQCRHEDRIDGQEFVANSPQPSNHSEMTTTSSNSDSGIGFNNDCRNIADRILVVDFANQQPPVDRFRQEMPRRPAGLVGCSSFDADGSFLSNTTPVVDGFGGQGRPLNLDDVILTSDLQTVRHVSPRKEEDSYNYNNVYSNMPSSSRGFPNGAVYDQVYTENECHYELIPPQLDLDSEVDRVGETFNSVEIYEERRQEYQSNESVENVTVISGETSKASMDSVSVYSSRSHEERRPSRRRHLQTSLDDMLVLGMRDQPEGREKDDDDNFVHPASVKFKIRKSKPLNLISRTCNMLVRKSRRSLSASAGDVTAECDVTADIVAAASEPDLREHQIQQDCGDIHGISQQTLSRLCKKVAIALAEKSQFYIKMPSNLSAEIETIRKFEAISGFPHVTGAIDCTHIKIRKVSGDAGQYYVNRKGHYSINTQVVCNADLKICDIVCHWRGSTHDARIFRESSIRRRFEENEFKGKLIGDSGYPCTPYLFTPVLRPRTEAERQYNFRHIRTRNAIERCFGLLKQRFRILLEVMRGSYDTIKTTIVVCAVLHNLAIEFNDALDYDEEYSNGDSEAEDIENIEQDLNNLTNIARNIFIENYF